MSVKRYGRAVPTSFRGFIHSSKEEAEVAELLFNNGIEYLPHRTYDLIMRDGEKVTYTVDFVFTKPVKLTWISNPIVFLDYRGFPLEKHDTWMEALCYKYDLKGYVAGGRQLRYWKNNGLLKTYRIPKGRPEE